jgi:tubulin gamma
MALTKRSPYVQTPYRVTGAMLFNHTSVAHHLKKVSEDYDKLRKRNAFLEMYKQHDLIDEFDECKTAVSDLIDEYTSCEKEDYIDRGSSI